MRPFKALALALAAVLSLTSAISAEGYVAPAPAHVWGWQAPVHAPVQATYHGQVQGNGYGQQGHGGGYDDGHGPDFYRVHGVSYHDHLNVRYGPGVRNPVVYTLPHTARGIQLGNCTQIATSYGPATWCYVSYQGYGRGWVNARYLAEDH